MFPPRVPARRMTGVTRRSLLGRLARQLPPGELVFTPETLAAHAGDKWFASHLPEAGARARGAEPRGGERVLPDGSMVRWREVIVAPESTPRTQSPAVIAASGRAPSLPARGQPAPRPTLPPMPILVEYEGGDDGRREVVERLGGTAEHGAGWRDLQSVSVLVADPEFAAQCYQTAFGWPRINDGLAGRGVVLGLGAIRLELIAPPSGGRVLPPGPHPTAIALRASDRNATLDYLRERGTADGAGRGVTPAKAHGLRIALP